MEKNQCGVSGRVVSNYRCAGDEILGHVQKLLAEMCDLVEFSRGKLEKIAASSDPKPTGQRSTDRGFPAYFETIRQNFYDIQEGMDLLRDLIERVEV